MMKWLAIFFRKFFYQSTSEPRVVIQKKSRDEYIYRIGNKRMIIYAELLSGDSGVEIDFGSIWKWMPPYDQTVLSWDERQTILSNFCKYLDSWKTPYIVKGKSI